MFVCLRIFNIFVAFILLYIPFTESNGKLSQLSISSKTAAWVPEVAVEDLALSRTATLVPEFAVKDLANFSRIFSSTREIYENLTKNLKFTFVLKWREVGISFKNNSNVNFITF